jgi:hypothetical protein
MAFRAGIAIQAEVPLVLVELWRILCTSSVSADSVLHHFGTESSQPYDYNKPLPGVFPS